MQKARGGAPDLRKEARATPPPENAPGSCSTLEELLPQVTCLYRDESASLHFNPTEDGALCRGGLESASLGNGEEESYKFTLFYCDPGANFHLVITESHTTIGKLDKPQQINAKEALKSDCS